MRFRIRFLAGCGRSDKAGRDSAGSCRILDEYPRRWIQLSREELYEQVWSRPILSVWKDLGISDRGLGKICERFKIPVPPRGYWAKWAAGRKLTKAPLPSVASESEPIRIKVGSCPQQRFKEPPTVSINDGQNLSQIGQSDDAETPPIQRVHFALILANLSTSVSLTRPNNSQTIAVDSKRHQSC